MRTFSSEDRLRTPEDYDQIVRADIPDPILEPRLHVAVMKHMLHNRCGVCTPTCPTIGCKRHNQNAVCMDHDKHVCKKNYPKAFVEETYMNEVRTMLCTF